MKKALSLIEVYISIAIVVIVIASILGIYSQGYRYLRKSRISSVVYNLAIQHKERYSDWDTLDRLDSAVCATDGNVVNTSPGSPYSPTNQPACPTLAFNTVTLNNVTYTPAMAISNGTGPDPNRVKRHDITISWTEDGVVENFTVVTYEANY